MKVLFINSVSYGSTMSISNQISEFARREGIETYFFLGYSSRKDNDIRKINVINESFIDKAIHMTLSSITGYEGVFSVISTYRLLSFIKKNKIDIVHLHNIHGWFVNYPLLIFILNKLKIRVIWTLHDCWAFTGHCTHFLISNCEKWKSKCYECGNYKEYPFSFKDNSSKMYDLKKRLFLQINDLTIVTPSKWLSRLVGESFLKEKRVVVINNGIDISIFNPFHDVEDIKKKFNNKFVILGVASEWNFRKGLDVFVDLAKRIDDSMMIVLVGTTEEVDKILPPNILSIHEIKDREYLARLYSASSVLLNPTREDNFPTVNLEAIACGTPVIAFDTGGVKETVLDDCGVLVTDRRIDNILIEIKKLEKSLYKYRDACIKKYNLFSNEKMVNEYIKLYRNN